MKKVLITGANGFVGSALCRSLSKKGIKVIALVRNETSDISRIEGLSNVITIFCEQSRIKDLPEMLTDRDIDVFYHFSWEGTSGRARSDSNIQTDNIRYTCESIRSCAKIGCKRFVYASSIMQYEIMNMVNNEIMPGINTVYSTAKLAADYMGRAVASDLGVEYLSGIISNIYGPGEKSPRLINTSLRKLLAGEHCSFSSGEQTYDFIYIEDAVEAFVLIGEKGSGGKSYYIGSCKQRPLKEFLIEMRDQIDPHIKIGLGELPSQGFSLSYTEFDIDALRRDTGFVPKVDFSEGIRKTVELMRRGNI